jgi:hypothetical protein
MLPTIWIIIHTLSTPRREEGRGNGGGKERGDRGGEIGEGRGGEGRGEKRREEKRKEQKRKEEKTREEKRREEKRREEKRTYRSTGRMVNE